MSVRTLLCELYSPLSHLIQQNLWQALSQDDPSLSKKFKEANKLHRRPHLGQLKAHDERMQMYIVDLNMHVYQWQFSSKNRVFNEHALLAAME